MTIEDTLIDQLKNKTARIAILGMGYVGLPLAVVFAEAGFHVTGVDPDKRKADSLGKGVSYIPDISTERLAPLVKSGHLSATTDFSVLNDCEAVSICVPTPLRKTGDPDMSFILSATARELNPEKMTEWMAPSLTAASTLIGSSGIMGR